MTNAPNEPVLLRRDEGRVAILTLNRPHALNALSGELIDALQAEFGFALAIATHDANVAARLRRAVELHDGRVVAA